jgi:hypothetical protein
MFIYRLERFLSTRVALSVCGCVCLGACSIYSPFSSVNLVVMMRDGGWRVEEHFVDVGVVVHWRAVPK